MKQLSIIPFLSLFSLFCYSQSAQTTPNGTLIANQNSSASMPSSSIFEVRSNTKGMLPPRMTTNRINAIISPTIGLMAYDIDEKCLKVYNGSLWECAGADIVASTPLSSSFAFQSITDNYAVSESIVADDLLNSISVGEFRGAITFGKQGNSQTLTSLGEYDGFIAKHDVDGNLIWATQIGGAANDQMIYDIAIDNVGNIAVTGSISRNTTFYSTNGAESTFTSTLNYSRIFVAKYNPSGVLIWYKVAASSQTNDCKGRGVTFDNNGNVVLTGMFKGQVSFDSILLTSVSTTEDIFISSLNGLTGSFNWVKSAGGISNEESGFEVICDATNKIYVFGYYSGTATFGELSLATNITSRGLDDFFVAKYQTNGNLDWVKTAGSINDESMGGIAYHQPSNSIYITGSYKGTISFGPGLGTNPLASVAASGYYNGFLAKYDSNGNILWSSRQGNTGSDSNYSRDVAVDLNGNVYVGGECQYNTYFYSSNNSASYYRRAVQYADPFITKYSSNGSIMWAIIAPDGESDFVRGLTLTNDKIYLFGNFKETINFGFCLKRNYLDTIINLHFPFWVNFDSY